MAEHLVDIADRRVVPYLIHFSERGMVPSIIRVKRNYWGPLVRTRKLVTEVVDGERVESVIEGPDLGELVSVYSILGKNLAYMNKLGVTHGDLHTGNVIIRRGVPLIFDWDYAVPPAFGNLGFDFVNLLKDTYDTFDRYGKSDCLELDSIGVALKTSFGEEMDRPLEVSHEEIHRFAKERFKYIN